MRLRERRGGWLQGRKGSSHPGEDAESLPLGGSRASAARDADPSSSLLPGEEGPVGTRENFRAHSLSVSPYLSCLPAQSLVLFKVCGSWEFVQFLGFEYTRQGQTRSCFWCKAAALLADWGSGWAWVLSSELLQGFWVLRRRFVSKETECLSRTG